MTEEDIEKLIAQTEALKLIRAEEQLLKSCKCEAEKVGHLIDLCCDLIPAPIAEKIILSCQGQFLDIKNKINNSKKLSDFFLALFYSILKTNIESIMTTELLNDYTEAITISNGIQIPNTIAEDYKIKGHLNYYTNTKYSIDDFKIDIKKHIKSNHYTSALIETIYFLLSNREIVVSIVQTSTPWNDYYPRKATMHSPFKNLQAICDLFIDIGAIDSAIKFYNIDERAFDNVNRLSSLAKKAVQSGNLEDSIKITNKLVEKEPYHPGISTIKAEIKRLEQRHLLKSSLSIDSSKVNELSGVEFENLIIDKFSSLGFKVESTPKTGDFGADLIVVNNEGSRIIVQCKRFKSKVNLKAVQEVVGAMGHYAGDIGIVITNNSFLNSAVKLAESHDIELWDGDKLLCFLAGDLSFSETVNT